MADQPTTVVVTGGEGEPSPAEPAVEGTIAAVAAAAADAAAAEVTAEVAAEAAEEAGQEAEAATEAAEAAVEIAFDAQKALSRHAEEDYAQHGQLEMQIAELRAELEALKTPPVEPESVPEVIEVPPPPEPVAEERRQSWLSRFLLTPR